MKDIVSGPSLGKTAIISAEMVSETSQFGEQVPVDDTFTFESREVDPLRDLWIKC